MNKAVKVLKKVPWKHVCKYGGYTLTTVAAAWNAMDTDKNVQIMMKKVASKLVTKK
jgi:hypothetical protein